jgi:hypothetical protein
MCGWIGFGGKTAMEYIIDFAGVAGAIVASMGLALWIEWVSLRGLMRLMPARQVNSGNAGIQPASGR